MIYISLSQSYRYIKVENHIQKIINIKQHNAISISCFCQNGYIIIPNLKDPDNNFIIKDNQRPLKYKKYILLSKAIGI